MPIPIPTELASAAAQVRKAARSDANPHYAAARCLCKPRFAGSGCDGCAEGWQGVDCDEPRPKEVRRELSAMREAERKAFFMLMARASRRPTSCLKRDR